MFDDLAAKWFENIVLKRAVVVFVSSAVSYFATHGFHHWGVNITVTIDSDTLKESLTIGLTTLFTTVHHWFARESGTVSKYL